MPGVDTTELDAILASWGALLRDFPGMKRKMLERLAAEILTEVQAEIPGTGTVRSWQERYIGTRNGYVAVRPKADTFKVTKGGKRYAVGYVTNAIDGGHKHRKPSQVKKAGYTYHPRINVAAVPGLHFYDKVRRRLEGMSQDELKELAAQVAAGLEGRG